jgi:hypothetical protein
MMISQELFDETLVESQEVFDYDDNDEAVRETISELQSQNKESRLDHLSLTHPDSEQGKKDRENQRNFVEALESEDLSLAMAIVINANAATKSEDNNSPKATIIFASLVLQHGFLQLRSKLMQRLDEPEDGVSTEEHELKMDEMIQFLLAMLSERAATSAVQQHPLIRELKLQLGRTLLQERWFPMFDKYPLLRLALISLARVCCNGCEANKKTLVQAGIRYQATTTESTITSGIGLWMECLPSDLNSTSNELMAKELCQLFSVLGKFQAGAEPAPQSSNQAPLVSSAHANVKEFYKCGAVHRLHQLAYQSLETHPTMSERKVAEREALLCQVLSALRVMAIDNDIVQNMVAVGILETLNTSGVSKNEGGVVEGNTSGSRNDLTMLVHQPNTAAATLGLLRNLCANDEIKTTLCRQSLASILQAMELHSSNAVVQEHGCGILAAMSLRSPNNAAMICHATNGAEPILKAMKAFPNKVPLQRQACLALRNIAVRSSPDEKRMLLDAGSEFVLREIAGRHQDSIDEAYAALRDLGCAAVKYSVDETGQAKGTQLFGTVQSNFRPVYD